MTEEKPQQPKLPTCPDPISQLADKSDGALVQTMREALALVDAVGFTLQDRGCTVSFVGTKAKTDAGADITLHKLTVTRVEEVHPEEGA